MRDQSKASGLRERLTNSTEDKLGKALTDLFDNPLISGTIGRAFDARERAAQAQELALSALNIPTAADIERLTRRLRSVSQRLEGIEDGVHRLNRALSEGGVERRLAGMEEQLKSLGARLSGETPKPQPAKPEAARRAGVPAGVAKPAGVRTAGRAAQGGAKPPAAEKRPTAGQAAAKPARKRPPRTSKSA
jgi:hypothetical protein